MYMWEVIREDILRYSSLQCVFGVDNLIIIALDVTSNRNMIFPKQHNYHPDFLSELMYFTLSLEWKQDIFRINSSR